MAKKYTVIENVAIHGIADKGKGVGRTADGYVAFVEGAVPGDVVDVFVQKKKSNLLEGVVQRIVQPSPERIEPFCQHFNVCGGCKWQYLGYAAQLQHKEQAVRDAFERISKVEVADFQPIEGSKETIYYRNKLEFGFADRRWLTTEEMQNTEVEFEPGLGFHRAGAFDKVVDIQHCWLQAEPSNAVRNAVRVLTIEQNLPFYNLRKHTGVMRNLMVRRTTTGETLLLFSFAKVKQDAIDRLLGAVLAQFGEQITTIVYCINQKLNDTVFDQDMIVWYGKGYVEERIGDLIYKIGPKSFFQTNTLQAKTLYDTVVEFADLKGDENIYDLYTGAGSIALYVARHCRQVVGIEEIPEAIDDALENRDRNGIDNAIFYAGDVKNVLTPEFAERHGRPDLVITDPPRAGMHEKAVRFLLELAAPRIVYVSCNPATQARDIQWLSEKYDVLKVRPVDMFPHTHHIENVALLALRNS